MDDKRIGPT